MRLKTNLQLRKIGSKYMVVDNHTGHINMVNVYTLNETAAILWEEMSKRDFTIADMAQTLCEQYDITEEQATHDAQVLLDEWIRFKLISSSGNDENS